MHTHTHTRLIASVYTHRPSVRSDVLRRTQTYSDVLYILLPSSGTPASVRSDGRQPSFPSVCRPSRRAGCFLPSCDAPAFTGISVERAKRVKSEGPGISVEREKRVKSEVRLACGWPAAVKHLRLACGWPAAVKHARKAPQNPVPTALSTHFVLYTHTHTLYAFSPAPPASVRSDGRQSSFRRAFRAFSRRQAPSAKLCFKCHSLPPRRMLQKD